MNKMTQIQRLTKIMVLKDLFKEYELLARYNANSIEYDRYLALNMAIKELQNPKIDKLYSYLNDMRFGIAPDETTPSDERDKRLAQIEMIDCIMEWIEKESE